MEQVFSYIISLGASVMMPILFTIIGLCIGMKFGKALKSGLYVGVGFVGLGLFLRNFKPEQAVREKPVANNIGEKASTQIPKLTHYGRNTDFSFIALLTFPEDQKTYVPCSRISIQGEEPPLRPGMTCDFLYHTYTDRQMEIIPGGIEFIEEENRLILNDFHGKDYILIAEDMGTDLTVESSMPMRLRPTRIPGNLFSCRTL